MGRWPSSYTVTDLAAGEFRSWEDVQKRLRDDSSRGDSGKGGTKAVVPGPPSVYRTTAFGLFFEVLGHHFFTGFWSPGNFRRGTCLPQVGVEPKHSRFFVRSLLCQVSQRVQASLWYIHRPQSKDLASPLRPNHIPYTYMDAFALAVFGFFMISSQNLKQSEQKASLVLHLQTLVRSSVEVDREGI